MIDVCQVSLPQNVETNGKLLGQTSGWVGEFLRKAPKPLAFTFPFLEILHPGRRWWRSSKGPRADPEKPSYAISVAATEAVVGLSKVDFSGGKIGCKAYTGPLDSSPSNNKKFWIGCSL